MPKEECKNHKINHNELKLTLYSFNELIYNYQKADFSFSYNDIVIFLVKQFLKKVNEYKTKSLSYTFPTKKVSTTYTKKIKSSSYSFEKWFFFK